MLWHDDWEAWCARLAAALDVVTLYSRTGGQEHFGSVGITTWHAKSSSRERNSAACGERASVSRAWISACVMDSGRMKQTTTPAQEVDGADHAQGLVAERCRSSR